MRFLAQWETARHPHQPMREPALLRFPRALSIVCMLALTLSLTLAACGSNSSSNGSPSLRHIFYIMMENHATNEIIGNTADAPYLNQLASKYGVALNYYGVTHPSLPNYLAAISGSSQGIWDDCAAGGTVTCAPEEFQTGASYSAKQLLTPAEEANTATVPHMFSSKNIVDQLDAKSLTWKAYFESMPSVDYRGEFYAHKLYAQKHNPFDYFGDIISNPNRVKNLVPFTQFATDLNANNVPNFVWITPNQCHDMHGLSTTNALAENVPQCAYPASGLDHGAIQAGDKFLSNLIPQIMGSKAWSEGAAIVLAWDEDDYNGYAGCCHSPTGVNGATLGGANAPAIVISSLVKHHISDASTQYNHYSLLATIEKIWGLGCLNNACGFSDSQLMTRFFM